MHTVFPRFSLGVFFVLVANIMFSNSTINTFIYYQYITNQLPAILDNPHSCPGSLHKPIQHNHTGKIFTVCVDLVFGNKCVQFREICLLQCNAIINTFWVDHHSELLKKVPVKPKNSIVQTSIMIAITAFEITLVL